MSEQDTNRRKLADGEVLFREGDPGDCAYIIESGVLEISTLSEGEPVVLCALESGDIVGEMGAIDRAPRNATARAIGSCELMVITRDALTERIARSDPIVRLLVKILLDRSRSGLNKVLARRDDIISQEAVGEYVHQGIDKIRLEAELKEGLKQGQLEVRYQPLLDVLTRKVAGYEALTRWEHPQRGQISPRLFITLAEETALIVPVGLHVFEQACSDLARFSATAAELGYDKPPFMAINVSARQIADPYFIEQVAEITDRHGVKRNQIKLEMTESLAVRFHTTRRWISKAQGLGLEVALDDFGTGFSSLETLGELAIDTVKIDQAFVRGLAEDRRARELLRGIIGLMKGLGMQVVVEGIETPYDLSFVAAQDCHLAQGYLIGKPLPADAAGDLLAQPLKLD